MAASLANLDEQWAGMGDLTMVLHRGVPQKTGPERGAAVLLEEDLPELFGSGEPDGFRSMGDLLKDFDEKLSACFPNDTGNTDSTAPVGLITSDTASTAPVGLITEDSLLEDDEIWNALTDNYGKMMAVDWKQSRTCSLHIPIFNLEEKPRESEEATDLSDEEELREQLDMHSIIVSCLSEEPLFTAEQVIEEIEEMMQDSPDMEAHQNPSQSDLSMLSLDIRCSSTSNCYEDRVRTMTVAELNERLEETETAILRFSEELVQQLALRDELEFEKEVRNSFISALITVQNRQKEQREALKKKKKLKSVAGSSQSRVDKTLGSRFSMVEFSTVIQNGFRHTFGSGCSEKQYLTTVIPYEKKGHPPSIEDLQILTKILQAMRDDSDKVPSLLTDYILKVLCPT